MPVLMALGGALKPVQAFLARVPWQVWLALAIAAAFALTVHNRNHWKAVATERQAELVQLHVQLDAISTARNTQAQTTKTNIVTVTKTIHDAEQKAVVVETAPIAPTQCHGVSPKVVMGADL